MEAPAAWYEAIRGQRPPSVQWPRATQKVQKRQRQHVDPARKAPCSSCCVSKTSCDAKSTKNLGKDSSEYHRIGESSCVLGRVRRDCSRSPGRFFEASPFPGGNGPCASLKSCEEFVVDRAQKRVSQAEVVVTGAVEHRDGMKVEFEEGQRRFANMQVEAQNPPAPIPLVGERGRNPPIAGTCGRVGRDQCC